MQLTCALALLFAGSAASAQGLEEFKPSLSFHGFGTLGVAHSTEDKADFLAQDLQGTGAGLGRSWSPDIDTRAGVQLDAAFTPQLYGVLQIISEQRYDGSYNPQVEWANLKYQVTPDFNIRAGRIVLPVLMVSDSRRVGYAQPWVRPPVEVYSLVPITKSDGVDMSYRMSFGEVNNTFRVGYSLRDIEEALPDGGDVVSKDGWQISNMLQYGDASLHMAYTRTKLTVEAFRPLFDGYREFAQVAGGFGFSQTSAQATALADKYDTDNKRFEILSIGGSYDPGDWFAMAEWVQTEQRSVLGKRQAWYVTGGYRFGAFTPYLTYAEAKFKSNQSDPGLTGVHPLLAGTANQLNAALNDQLAGAPIQKTVSVGVRWDVARNTALKLQYDRTNIGSGSTGTLDHALPDYKLGGGFEVFSATIDFVF
ncbi:MAG: hypothetical protein ACO1NO_12370 [Burkholderiaceae bacterium]